MSSRTVTVSSLKKASRLVRDAMLAVLPAPEDCSASFSPSFLRESVSIMKKARSIRRRTVVRQGLSAAAGFVLVFLLLFFSLNSTARAALVNWVREVTEHSALYRLFVPERPADTLPSCTPGWLPEGLLPEPQTFIGERAAGYTWSDASGGSLLTLDLFLINENTQLSVTDTAGFSCREVDLRGGTADLYTNGNQSVLIWTEDGILCQLAGICGEEDLLKTAEALVLR